MNILLAVTNSSDIQTYKEFLRGVTSSAQIKAVAVVPGVDRFQRLRGITQRGWQGKIRELAEMEHTHASALLEEFQSAISVLGLKADAEVLKGDAADKIIAEGRRWKADLIAISKKDDDPKDLPPPGYLPTRIARYSRSSVLLLDAKHPSLRSLLLATDGSRQATGAVTALLRIPLPPNPALYICSVVAPLNPAFVRTGSYLYRDYQNSIRYLYEAEREVGVRIVGEVAARVEKKNFDVHTLVPMGETVEEILKAINSYKIDLLALGAKGISSRGRFLLGSVSLKLLHQAPCSLMIAR